MECVSRPNRKINALAKVSRQALAPAEADEGLDRLALSCRQGRPAAGQKLVALGPPRGQPLRDFFATGREPARP
jgi:hypothetical protein